MLAYLLDLGRVAALVLRPHPIIAIPIASNRESVAVECELGSFIPAPPEKAATVCECNSGKLRNAVAQPTE
jgi:hypothetical protein